MNKGKLVGILEVVLETILLAGITIVAALPLSCKITAAGIEIVGGDYTAPVLQEVTVLGEDALKLSFSEAVKVKQAVVSPVIASVSDSGESAEEDTLAKSIEAALGKYDSIKVSVENISMEDAAAKNAVESNIKENDCAILFRFEEKTVVGKSYELFGIVEDSVGNSLCFSVPFTGFNSAVPELIMTELHTGMAGQLKSEKEENVRRLEYVEFLALTEGNLAGLEFCSSYAGDEKKYTFPAVHVNKGEIIVLHLRTWGDGCISEDGTDLNLAFSKYCGDYRDLWSSQTTKSIGDTTDVLVLYNSISGRVEDAVMYRSADVEEWDSKLKENYFQVSGFSDVYSDYSVESGTDSTGLSATKFLYRTDAKKLYDAVMSGKEVAYPVKADENSWQLTSEATPGIISQLTK